MKPKRKHRLKEKIDIRIKHVLEKRARVDRAIAYLQDHYMHLHVDEIMPKVRRMRMDKPR